VRTTKTKTSETLTLVRPNNDKTNTRPASVNKEFTKTEIIRVKSAQGKGQRGANPNSATTPRSAASTPRSDASAAPKEHMEITRSKDDGRRKAKLTISLGSTGTPVSDISRNETLLNHELDETELSEEDRSLLEKH
jgi:hypothetical protein